MIFPHAPTPDSIAQKNSKPREEPSQQQETQSNESSSQPTGASQEQSDSLTPSEPQKPQETQPTESKEETKQQETQLDKSKEETTTRFFQAVGVIEGDVSFDKKGNAQVIPFLCKAALNITGDDIILELARSSMSEKVR